MKLTYKKKLRFFWFLLLLVLGLISTSKIAAEDYLPNYTNDITGIYPSSSWKPDSQEDVINNQGYVNGNTTLPKTFNTIEELNEDDDSYIRYGDQFNSESSGYALRKTAYQTDTPGLYDIYLNVRGYTSTNETDIVFVADWSGSMNKTIDGQIPTANNPSKIKLQKDALNKILTDIKGQKNLKIGFIGYSSDETKNNTWPWEKGKIKAGSNCSTGVLLDSDKSLDVINEQYDKYATNDKVIENGATFTEKAILDAQTMLSNSSAKNKRIILLTDGVPTFSYHVTSVTNEVGPWGDNKDHTISINKENGVKTLPDFVSPTEDGINYKQIDGDGDEKYSFSFNRKGNNYQASGFDITNSLVSLRGTVKKLKNINLDIMGIGLRWGSEGSSDITSALDGIAHSANGDFENTNNQDDINNYINNDLLPKLSGNNSIDNGSIIDPLGSQYQYKDEKVDIEDITKEAQNKIPENVFSQIRAVISNNQLRVSPITLGNGQELQIHYQAQLKTDGAFKPNTWYQMNGRTLLTPVGASPETQVDFGVPSGREPGIKLDIEKKWENDDPTQRPRAVEFILHRKLNGKIDSSFEALGTIKGDNNSDKWSLSPKEIVKPVEGIPLSIENLPKYDNSGIEYEYSVEETTKIPGYKPSYDGTTITNTYTPFSLNVQKIWKDDQNKWNLRKDITLQLQSSTDKKNWEDVDNKSFVIKKDSEILSATFGDLPYLKEGKNLYYRIVEKIDGNTIGVSGYKNPIYSFILSGKDSPIQTREIEANDENNNGTLQVTNELLTTTIEFLKIDGDGTILKGAQFKLLDKTTKSEIKSSISDNEGKISFSDIPIGKYQVIETKAPDGYKEIKPFDVSVIQDSSNTEKLIVISEKTPGMKIIDLKKIFKLSLTKIDSILGTKLKGATFELSGGDLSNPESKTSDDNGYVEFSYNLTPGESYELREIRAPEGYKLIENMPWTVTISKEEPNVLSIKDSTGKVVATEIRTSNKETPKEYITKYSFDVKDVHKGILPKTGGPGTKKYIIGSILMFLIASIFLLVTHKMSVREEN